MNDTGTFFPDFCFDNMSKKTGLLIGFTTVLPLLYSIIATLPIAFTILFILFLALSALMIWMVISILKTIRT